MSTDRSTWNIVGPDGAYTIVEVPIEPGQVMQVPILTRLLDTPVADAIVANLIDDRRTRKDQLREPL